jgi:hypothetical protein
MIKATCFFYLIQQFHSGEKRKIKTLGNNVPSSEVLWKKPKKKKKKKRRPQVKPAGNLNES